MEITVLDEADHMADLGFLPAVRELLSRTPPGGQRLLFSATLDAGIDVLAKRFLNDPVTHSVDETPSPTATMAHHVLRVRAEDRVPVLTDLAAAPGRTLVFTRTKRGAARLARQLSASGVAAVELHGNLGQQARARNLRAFAEGEAGTLVATDIAARGIHVDGIALVIHADPPAEHKAYVHRSGRTARAGAEGTVVTLMTNTQAREVAVLLRKAGIAATTTEVGPGHAILTRLAPGARRYTAPAPAPAPARSPEAKPARRRRKPNPPANPPAGAAEGRQPKPAHGTKSRHRAGHGGNATRRGGAADLSARTRVGARRGR